MKRELKTFDNPKNVRRLLMVFYTSLVVLLVSEFFVHMHGDFAWEEMPFFFGTYGFVSCVALIYIAKVLRMFIKRNEDHYDKG